MQILKKLLVGVLCFVIMFSISTVSAFAHAGIDHSKNSQNDIPDNILEQLPKIDDTIVDASPLRQGQASPELKIYQQLLIEQGYLNSEATGFFGPLTKNAVLKFQLEHNIAPSGTLNEETVDALLKRSGEEIVAMNNKNSFQVSGLIASIQALTAAITTTPRISFTTSKRTIQAGQTFTLSWIVVNATACTARGSWSGKLSASGMQTLTLTTPGTYTYTIRCKNGSKIIKKSVKVSVVKPETTEPVSAVPASDTTLTPKQNPVPTLSFASSPASVTAGGKVVLSWTSANASSCTGEGFLANAVAGSVTLSPTQTTTYSMTCTGVGGSVTQKLTIAVSAPSTSTPTPTPSVSVPPLISGAITPYTTTSQNGTMSITASLPSYVKSGDDATFTWSAVGVASCTVYGFGNTLSGLSGSVTFTNVTSSRTGVVVCDNGKTGSEQKKVNVSLNVMASEYAGQVLPPLKNEPASVSSNFDVNSELVPSWGHGQQAVAAAENDVGAFRFVCNPSHLGYDDPIVYPGQPGRSHLHQFFGNTLTSATSTYESLRKRGQSTCSNPLNRSAYWIPAMVNGDEKVVQPDYVVIYYKRAPITSPGCQKGGVACVDLPRGLKYVFGYSMTDPSAAPTGSGYFNCDGPTAVAGHYPNITEAAKNCPTAPTVVNGVTNYNRLGAVISAPNCWDGKNLDSSDHRKHVNYASYGSWGYPKCPGTHPYIIPTFTLGAWYTVDSTLNTSGVWSPETKTWYLSSDKMSDGMQMKPGTTLHADWFGAWDDGVKKMWEDNCLNKHLSCSGGDLGNGKQLKNFSGFTMNASPRLLSMPPKP